MQSMNFTIWTLLGHVPGLAIGAGAMSGGGLIAESARDRRIPRRRRMPCADVLIDRLRVNQLLFLIFRLVTDLR